MLGFQAGATVSIEETRKAFERVFGEGGRFGKATDELANTFAGTLSMVGDKVTRFKQVLLEAGFFEELKSQFGDLDDFLEKNAEDLDKIATTVGKNLAQAIVGAVDIGKKLIPFLKEIKQILGGMIDAFNSLPAVMQQAGIVGAFLLGKKGFIGLAVILDFMNRVDKFTEKFGDKPLKFPEIEPFESELSIPIEEEATKKLIKDNKKITEEIIKQKEQAFQLSEVYYSIHQGMKELPKSIEGFGGALEGFGEGLSSELDVTVFERFKKSGQDSLSALKNSITDFVMTGKLSFQTLSQAIIRSIVEAMVGSAVTAAIKKATEIFKFAAIREGLISAFKAGLKALASVPFPFNIAAAGAVVATGIGMVNKIKGFEKGGAVAKGQPVMVGERGAELFIPNQTGQITQSARGTGNGGTTVNFNINTVDASGFEDLLIRSRGTISSLINQAVNEQGRGAIV